MRLRSVLLALPTAAIAAGSIAAHAQTSGPVTGTMHYVCNVGSFKMVNGTGKVEFNFQGTVLVSKLKGTAVPSGNLKLEYDKGDKKAYFGNGHITVQGEFKSIQWFGSGLSGSWVGSGRAFLYGEYDKNLDTGYFWYEDPSQKVAWQTGGWTADLPSHNFKAPTPVIRGGH